MPPEYASMVPPGEEAAPVSTLESIARMAPLSASSVPPESPIVLPPVLSVSVTPAPEARTTALAPVLSNVRSLDPNMPWSPIWPVGVAEAVSYP